MFTISSMDLCDTRIMIVVCMYDKFTCTLILSLILSTLLFCN